MPKIVHKGSVGMIATQFHRLFHTVTVGKNEDGTRLLVSAMPHDHKAVRIIENVRLRAMSEALPRLD